VLLTGEVGTGKTTLCRSLIEQLPETVDVALLLNPRLTAMELLAALFDELRISYDPNYTLKDFTDTLSSYLLTAHSVGRHTVLILDEAQNLTSEVLEQVRLLTNLETSSHKLLQIILVGQPELNRLLTHNNLRQLSQRITARYHLLPLSSKDTRAYINHRLAISGAHSPLFTDAAMHLVYRYSGGIPRLINIICDRALLGGYVNNESQIETHVVRKAVQEVRGDNINVFPKRSGLMKGLVIAAFLLVALLVWWWASFKWPFLTNLTPSTNLSLSVESEGIPLPESTLPHNDLPSNTTVNLPLSHDEDTSPTPSKIITEPKNEVSIAPIVSSPPHLLDILKTTNTELAFITLFKLWGLDYTQLTGDKACQRAATQGLACLLRTGTWDDLRHLNRPAVIELVTDNGQQYHVVVTHLQDENVTLAISENRFKFSTNDVNQYWLGQFLLLWQPPSLPIKMLKVGMTHQAVVWIRKHLNIIEGRSNSHLFPRFDQALKRRIIAFQRQYNLSPDGIVGEQSLLVLQAVGKGPHIR